MPSQYEPFGLVFAEAMAMTLPVVALANGGAVEVVENGVTGLLSAPGDAEALADNLRTLLLDPKQRAAFGARGRRACGTVVHHATNGRRYSGGLRARAVPTAGWSLGSL